MGVAYAAPAVLVQCGGEMKVVRELKLVSLREALSELQNLRQATLVEVPGDWNAAQVMRHLGQSIEFSMRGFPEMKSGLFRATVGRIAKAKFLSDGTMSHNLNDPIPGAPVLSREESFAAALAYLIGTVDSFLAYTGEVKPHFAYGDVTRAQVDQLQAMHIANHLSVMKY